MADSKKYYWRTKNGMWLVRDQVTGMVTSGYCKQDAIKMNEETFNQTDFKREGAKRFIHLPGENDEQR